MKAAVYDDAGEPGVLRYAEIRDPVCSPDGIVIRVEAISIEGGDLAHRAGTKPPHPSYVGGFAAAGAGGVGIAAIQFAKALGARVIATVTGVHRSERLKQLGLDEAIDHDHQDVVHEVMRLTKGRGVDLVIDPIGSRLEGSLAALRDGGRLWCSSATPVVRRCGLISGPRSPAILPCTVYSSAAAGTSGLSSPASTIFFPIPFGAHCRPYRSDL